MASEEPSEVASPAAAPAIELAPAPPSTETNAADKVTPTLSTETAATTEIAPSDTSEATVTTPTTPMTTAKNKRQSVANAAMLFAGGDSDPFANLIGAIGEEEEEDEEGQNGMHASQQAADLPKEASHEVAPVAASETTAAEYEWPPSQDEHLFGAGDGADPYAGQVQQPQLQQELDPYAQQADPYAQLQDPYAQPGGYAQVDQDAQPDPYAQLDSDAQQHDPYAQQHDPYAQQQDPYAQQHDPYAQQHDPYAQQSDPYAQQPDPYAQHLDTYTIDQQNAHGYGQNDEHQPDPYATQQHDSSGALQHDSYATPQLEPYGMQQIDPYSAQQPDAYGAQQLDPYAMPQVDPYAAQQGDAYVTQQDDVYGARQHHDPYSVQQYDVNGAAQQQDPYAAQQTDPYAVPQQNSYGELQQSDPYGAQEQFDPYGQAQHGVQQQSDPYAPSQQHSREDDSQADDYATHSQQPQGEDPYAQPDAYAQQPDPYATSQRNAHEYDDVAVQGDDYDATHLEQPEEADPYARQPDPQPMSQQGSHEDEFRADASDAYAAHLQQPPNDDPYAQQPDPYATHQDDSYGYGHHVDPADAYSAHSQRPEMPNPNAHMEAGAGQQRELYAEQSGLPSQPDLYAADRREYTGYDAVPQETSRDRDRSTRIPLICFSVDGKLVTHFPSAGPNGANDDGAAYGMGLAGTSTQVTIRNLSSEIPSTTYATCLKPLQFPGPLFEMTSGSALTRGTSATSSSSKAKKATLIKHLNEAANELSSGIGYLHANQSPESKRIEDRVSLVRILSLALEHDGNMQSNAAFDKAVVEMLLSGDGSEDGTLAIQQDMSRTPSSAPSSDGGAALATTSVASGNAADAHASLDQLQRLLALGKRSEAVELAKSKKLWTHAVIIASGMDKETWRDVVSAFIDAELDDGGHQSLKVAYSVFSGQEARSLYDLFRPKQVIAPPGDAVARATSHDWRRAVAMIIANRTPPSGGSGGTGGDSANLTAIGDGLLLAGWLEAAHVCYLLSPATSGLDGHGTGSARLTLLGAQSPEASASYLRDLDAIMLTEVWEFALSLRPVPKGSEAYQGLPYLQAYRIVHAYYLAEMGEHKKALRYCDAITSVLKTGKMNRHYHPVLLQQLQELSFRLSGGDGGGKGGSQGGAAGWARKKPTMDSVWGALENRFTKFIAGEDEGSTSSKASPAAGGAGGKGGPAGVSPAAVGAFTHYSAITPEATSRDVSRTQSYADFSGGSGSYTPVPPPAHPPSNSSGTSYSRPVSRASSTFEGRPGVSPLSNMSNFRSASSAAQPYSEWPTSAGPSYGAARGNYDRGLTPPPPGMREQSTSSDTDGYGGPYTTHATRNAPWYASSNGGAGGGGHSYEGSASGEGYEGGEQRTSGDDTVGQPGGAEGPYYGYDSHGAGKPQFVSNIDQDLSDALDVEGFVSPMDALGGAPTPTFSYAPPAEQRNATRNDVFDDDDDDLGLGNSRGKPRRDADRGNGNDDDEGGSGEARTPTSAATAHAQRDSNASAASSSGSAGELRQTSSWFGRFWSRGATPSNEPKAVRAHLGDETSFYFDKDLKRWVNKKSGGDDASQASATPPPPPQRAATASPSMGRGAPPRSFSGGPPSSLGGPPSLREAQRAVSSSALSFGSSRSAAPINETVEEAADEGGSGAGSDGYSRQQAAGPPPPGRQPISRPRSNLADHSQPPALQGSSSSEAGGAGLSGMPPRPPPSTAGSGFKKKPISKRYVRVD